LSFELVLKFEPKGFRAVEDGLPYHFICRDWQRVKSVLWK
jgi:hypothetical protein